jgi:hypothetical protein
VSTSIALDLLAAVRHVFAEPLAGAIAAARWPYTQGSIVPFLLVVAGALITHVLVDRKRSPRPRALGSLALGSLVLLGSGMLPFFLVGQGGSAFRTLIVPTPPIATLFAVSLWAGASLLPGRLVPAAAGLWLLHTIAQGIRFALTSGSTLAAVFALALFVPLLLLRRRSDALRGILCLVVAAAPLLWFTREADRLASRVDGMSERQQMVLREIVRAAPRLKPGTAIVITAFPDDIFFTAYAFDFAARGSASPQSLSRRPHALDRARGPDRARARDPRPRPHGDHPSG